MDRDLDDGYVPNVLPPLSRGDKMPIEGTPKKPLPKLKRRLISRPKLVREILSELKVTGLTLDNTVRELIQDIKEADFEERF
jgi:hypothetical protein